MSYRLSFFLPPIGLSSVRSVSVSLSVCLSVDYTSFCMSVWLILAQSVCRQISLIKHICQSYFSVICPFFVGIPCLHICLSYTSCHLSVNFSLLAYLSVSSLTERTCKIPNTHSSCLQIGHFQKQVTGEPWMCYCPKDIYHIERVPYWSVLKGSITPFRRALIIGEIYLKRPTLSYVVLLSYVLLAISVCIINEV
jgi:hypothetical protein